MPYMDEMCLSRYDPKLKEWISSQPVKTIPSTLYPWTLTAKAGAVTCWPVGGTELKPTVDFLFTETPPASGDKGPENPSMITGVSSVMVSQIGGKNLLACNFSSVSVTNNTTGTVGQTTATNNNGVYSLSGTVTSTVNNVYITRSTEEQNVLKIPAGTYTLSGYTKPADSPSGTALSLQLLALDGGSSQTVYCTTGYTTFTINTVCKCNVYIRAPQGLVYPTGFTCSPQLEQGSEATAFESSYVTNYTIPLNDTYYGGSIDLATGVMTVTHYGYTFTGQESFSYRTFGTFGRWECGTAAGGFHGTTDSTCTHYPFGTAKGCIGITGSGTTMIYFVVESGAASPATFLAEQYAADTPVVFVTKLPTAEQYTVTLTPTEILSLTQTDKYTPRLNTVYTDANAVQVGYVKSPIREEFELQQAIVAQGGNI